MLDQMNFLMIQSQSRMEQEQKDMDTLLSTFTENIVDNQQDQEKMKRRRDYSNTKVKTRNLLTNVSYRRFKQSDFNKTSFIVDILSFLVQNFSPINLERKLDVEKERDMVKYLWDNCIPHDFVRYIYKRANNFGIQKKNNFDFYFQTWKNRKTAGAIAPKLLKQLPLDQAKHITTEVLSTVKGRSNYQDSAVQKNEQMPNDIKISDSELIRATMVSVNNKTDKTVVKTKSRKKKNVGKAIKRKHY